MQALVIRILRDVYVLDITVNFMLNKRKSKKADGASPQTPLGELSALPQTPLLSREGARPLPYPPPVVNLFIRPPPFPKSWIRLWFGLLFLIVSNKGNTDVEEQVHFGLFQG